MCGIIAYLGSADIGGAVVVNGLGILQNRGYDSAGVLHTQQGKFTLLKKASTPKESSVAFLEEHACQTGTCVIGHTRWATHGPRTDVNAHPHVKGKWGVVHNGIIENHSDLRSLASISDTDSESILDVLNSQDGGTLGLLGVFYNSIQRLKGTWAIVAVNKSSPNSLFIATHGSPLVLGYDDSDSLYVSSEVAGFEHSAKQWLPIPDNSIFQCELSGDGIVIHTQLKTMKLSSFVPLQKCVFDITSMDACMLVDYPHWTLKEIHDSPAACTSALNQGGRLINTYGVKLGGLDTAKDTLLRVRHLILLACGTSLHAACITRESFARLGGFHTVQCFDASEFNIQVDMPKHGQVACVFISQSGETRDCHRLICELKEQAPGVVLVGVVNVVSSMISRDTDCGVYVNAGREVGVASTKSFFGQVVVLLLISLWYSYHQNTLPAVRQTCIQNITRLPSILRAHMHDAETWAKSISSDLHNTQSMFILGRGVCHVAAQEAALKIKELSCIHVEAFAGGALKHGPFALIQHGTPVMLIITNGNHVSRMQAAAEEVRLRGADVYTLVRSEYASAFSEYKMFSLNVEDELSGALVAVLACQFLAYHLALACDLQPDFPRNLAKVVTVDG